MKKITVSNIRTNKFNTNEIEVTFSDSAKMNVDALTLAPMETVEVFTENKTLKAERYTKKYLEALALFVENCKIDVITHSENEQKIEYKVYQVGNKITAEKIDMQTGKTLCRYDWSHYATIQDAIKDMSNANNWHYRYTFYILSKDMAHTTATAIVNDIENNVPFDMADMDSGNLISTIAHATTNKVLYAFIIDGEKSIHMMFKKQDQKTFKESYDVLSAYNNGIGDRTTYNGLYRGQYDIPFYDTAENIVRSRANSAKGMHFYRELAF